MKTFRQHIQEAARKDHADGEFHTLNGANGRKLVLIGNEMVGHIDFHVGVPDIIPGDKDRYIAHLATSYRDSRLKINRPIFRRVGEFNSLEDALRGLKDSIKNLKK